MTRLIGTVNTGNNVTLGSLFYEFPIAGKVDIFLLLFRLYLLRNKR